MIETVKLNMCWKGIVLFFTNKFLVPFSFSQISSLKREIKLQLNLTNAEKSNHQLEIDQLKLQLAQHLELASFQSHDIKEKVLHF